MSRYTIPMTDGLHGVIQGGYFCNDKRLDEINDRLSARNVPSAPLQPQYSIRPVSTKYALMPVFDRRPKATVPIAREPTYSVETVFNPGSAQAPWSGFASNINAESSLRNQFFALQRCEQSEWVPSSKSDLYEVKAVGRQEHQPFPGLFTEEKFAPFDPNTCKTGGEIWGNHTRQQLMNGCPGDPCADCGDN
jgi:hypothetical protein